MGRVVLLALLALALPTVALAGSVVVFSVSTGHFVSGSMTNPFSHHFELSVLGSMYQMDLNTSIPAECPGDGFCTLSNGTVDVKRGTATVFTDSIVSGTMFVCIPPHCLPGFLLANDTIMLKPIDGVAYSATFEGEPVANPPPGPLTFGYATVVGTVPDYQPSTLELLLGTGVLGLAEMVRRKLKLVA